jgi:hypothetical protein
LSTFFTLTGARHEVAAALMASEESFSTVSGSTDRKHRTAWLRFEIKIMEVAGSTQESSFKLCISYGSYLFLGEKVEVLIKRVRVT